tara:strand:+ start:1063 stop:1599 length:537 start_codon:yes stop_codon:yes gene_type:complete
MAQIRQVVSESLQSTVRRLLPSQQGFTEDLQASNVITPIIDLTPSAEGSSLPVDLSRALAFGSQTAFSVNNSSAVIANAAGFWRIFGAGAVMEQSGVDTALSFTMTDGLSTKTIWAMTLESGSSTRFLPAQYDFVVFLDSGESISIVSNSGNVHSSGSARQVADINGELVNPSGFVQQ